MLGRVTLGLMAALALAPLASAQDFSPVVQVNDRVVTAWELDQRVRLLTFFNTPGDVAADSRAQLVEERLKQQELDRVGFELTPEGSRQAIEDFAARADLDAAQLTTLLGQNGIAAETLRDYVAINVSWRDYVRARFGDAAPPPTQADLDRRVAQDAAQAAGVEVLLSEIIIPAPPPEAARVQALALEISRLRDAGAFEAAARRYSATATREAGGRLDWAPLSNYPAALGPILLGLAPGEVTAPIPLEGAVALLLLRDVREAPAPAAAAVPAEVDHAVLRIPGGLSEAALATAQGVAARTDTCDDLYATAPEGAQLTRQALPPDAIAPDVALALAPLDADEIAWGATADGGATLLLVMLCARTYPLPEGAPDLEAVASAFRSEALGTYSDALVADLRAAATIVGE